MDPARRNAPDQAQVMLVYISLGVISLKHLSGLAASGMIKPSYRLISDNTPKDENLALTVVMIVGIINEMLR